MFGDAVVLAYTPGPPGHPAAEVGLLLVHTRRPEMLAALLDRLADRQQKAGEITAVEQREYLGQRYVVRRKKVGGEEFYFLRGSTLAFTDKEARSRRPSTEPKLPTRPIFRHLKTIAVTRRRTGFHDLVGESAGVRRRRGTKVAMAKGAGGGVSPYVRSYWKTLDGGAVSLALGRNVSINFVVQAKTDALPAPAPNGRGGGPAVRPLVELP